MNWLCCRLEDFSREQYDTAYRQLSPTRRARIDRYRRQEDKLRSLAGELLARALAAQAGIACPLVEQLESGQPVLKDGGLHISIAHSGELVACAIHTAPVGIDVEQLRPFRAGMLRHVCTEAETAYVLGGAPLPEGEMTDAGMIDRFFEVWTGKEAFFKRAGTGITDLKSIDILSMPREVFRVDGYMIQIM